MSILKNYEFCVSNSLDSGNWNNIDLRDFFLLVQMQNPDIVAEKLMKDFQLPNLAAVSRRLRAKGCRAKPEWIPLLNQYADLIDFSAISETLVQVASAASPHFIDQGKTMLIKALCEYAEEQDHTGYDFRPDLLIDEGKQGFFISRKDNKEIWGFVPDFTSKEDLQLECDQFSVGSGNWGYTNNPFAAKFFGYLVMKNYQHLKKTSILCVDSEAYQLHLQLYRQYLQSKEEITMPFRCSFVLLDTYSGKILMENEAADFPTK